QDGLHALVDLVARPLDVELGLGAHRQCAHAVRPIGKVALVRAPDEVGAEPEGRDDLRRAGDERDDPHGSKRSRRYTRMTMRFLAGLLLASALVAAPGAARAQSDDWGVKRDPFDKRIVERWKAAVERDPSDRAALRKLWDLYVRYSKPDKLIGE